MLSSRQCHCVHKCNTIGLSSFCISQLSVPKVEVGKGETVPIVELGEQRVKEECNQFVTDGNFPSFEGLLKISNYNVDVLDVFMTCCEWYH